MEVAEQAPPGQTLGKHGCRAVEYRNKAEVFAKMYADVSRWVLNKLQDAKPRGN